MHPLKAFGRAPAFLPTLTQTLPLPPPVESRNAAWRELGAELLALNKPPAAQRAEHVWPTDGEYGVHAGPLDLELP